MPSTSALNAATVPARNAVSVVIPLGAGALARDRADRTVAGLTSLFAARPELRGVHAPADLAEDFVRWSA